MYKPGRRERPRGCCTSHLNLRLLGPPRLLSGCNLSLVLEFSEEATLRHQSSPLTFESNMHRKRPLRCLAA
jgi:hypothetical protein